MRSSAHWITAMFGAILLSTEAKADIHVTFIEGAPKDRFEIQNVGACTMREGIVTVDLENSNGALVFDVAGGGAGLEVFQPFQIVEGQDALTSLPTVADGQTSVALEISALAPGQRVVFTIDVDDTIGTRSITVTDAEIAGATVSLAQSGTDETAAFSANAIAALPVTTC
ncbi:aggregation factor core [Shimia sp. R10_1]|uniref:aggregation factor core n=1 Tax=Shimia sp. R10_1 TaxID=2821095 RepID=UPI001FFE299F|nr:aggregation factor core [Shimia sp. R10_1]